MGTQSFENRQDCGMLGAKGRSDIRELLGDSENNLVVLLLYQGLDIELSTFEVGEQSVFNSVRSH